MYSALMIQTATSCPATRNCRKGTATQVCSQCPVHVIANLLCLYRSDARILCVTYWHAVGISCATVQCNCQTTNTALFSLICVEFKLMWDMTFQHICSDHWFCSEEAFVQSQGHSSFNALMRKAGLQICRLTMHKRCCLFAMIEQISSISTLCFCNVCSKLTWPRFKVEVTKFRVSFICLYGFFLFLQDKGGTSFSPQHLLKSLVLLTSYIKCNSQLLLWS